MAVKKDNKTAIVYEPQPDPEIPFLTSLFTYFSYMVLIAIGYIRDTCVAITGISRYGMRLKKKKGYGSLFKSSEDFYTRRLYHRISDCWNLPISSAPGVHVTVMDRVHRENSYLLDMTGTESKCLNVASYNYLGFADDWHVSCKKEVMEAVNKYPSSMCSARMDIGTLSIHEELEETVAHFVGKEAAAVFSMGFGTNSTTIPSIMGKDSLIISDSLNHTSIVNGARASASQIRVFKHNDPKDLESVLRESILRGQPRKNRPWKKVLVMVEGIYSMEGAICKLKEIVAICKKYKAYIYVDEAHSIGALGKNGKGICEYAGIDPSEIDILMGTFSKSFSGMGGYLASSKKIIDHIKTHSSGQLSDNSLSPIVTQQVLTAFKVIMGKDGTNIGRKKINSLIENSNYFRYKLIEMGLHVYGDYDSPIIPIMLYLPCKIAAFSRECRQRGLAVVVVGFPATSVVMSRARFCISAGHTREDMDKALAIIDEVAKLLHLKYEKNLLK